MSEHASTHCDCCQLGTILALATVHCGEAFCCGSTDPDAEPESESAEFLRYALSVRTDTHETYTKTESGFDLGTCQILTTTDQHPGGDGTYIKGCGAFVGCGVTEIESSGCEGFLDEEGDIIWCGDPLPNTTGAKCVFPSPTHTSLELGKLCDFRALADAAKNGAEAVQAEEEEGFESLIGAVSTKGENSFTGMSWQLRRTGPPAPATLRIFLTVHPDDAAPYEMEDDVFFSLATSSGVYFLEAPEPLSWVEITDVKLYIGRPPPA